MDQPVRTRVLHVDDSCADKTCPAIIEVVGMTGHKAVVGRLVTDPVLVAALGVHVGPGEGVLLIPDSLYAQIKEH